MKSNIVKSLIIKYAVITFGCVIYSLGIALFLDAHNLAAGGVTGISIILNYAVPVIDTGIWILILNVPLLILGAIFFGRNFTISTIYSTVVSSLLIELWNFAFKSFIPPTDNVLIAALIGSVLYGGGLGVIFRMGSSTGGTDVIVKILRRKFRYIKTGIISMIIDMCIVLLSAIVFYFHGESNIFDHVCYTAVSIVVFSLSFDWILYGGNSAKLIYIITTEDKASLMCERLLKDLDIGATLLDGEGAYTHNDRRIILCAIKNFLYPKLRDIISEIDPHAFTIVSSAKEIYGEGYKQHGDEL